MRALLLALALATRPAAASDAAEGLLEQHRLPEIAARRASAEARVEAARAWFDGRSSRDAAFPDLAGAPVGDPAWLRAERARIEGAVQARAAERVAPPPEGLDADGARAWRDALVAATDAEDAADALELRFLAGLAAGLDAAPDLTDAAIASEVASWRDLRAKLPADADPAALALAAAAGDAEAELSRWREAAWRRMTVPDDGALVALLPGDDLAARLAPVGATADGLRAAALADRLSRVAPLLPSPVRDRVVAALAARTAPPVAAAPPVLVTPVAPPAAPDDDEGVRARIEGLRAQAAEIRAGEGTRHDAAVAVIAALGARVAATRTGLEAALALPPLDPDRQPAIDRRYLEAWDLLDEARAALADADATRRRLASEVAAGPSAEGGAASTGQLADLAAAQRDLDAALGERDGHAEAELQALGRLVDDTQTLRRLARARASADARRVIARRFLPDLAAEVGEMPLRARVAASRLLDGAGALPALLLDLTTWTALLFGSAEIVALGAVWFLARSRSRQATSSILGAGRALADDVDRDDLPRRVAERVRDAFGVADLRSLEPLLAPIARAAVDAVALALVLLGVAGGSAWLALLAWAILFAVAMPALDAAVGLVVTADDVRAALVRASAAEEALARRSARLLARWWFVSRIAGQVALPILGADRVADLVSFLSWCALAVLAVVLLRAWGPSIRRVVAEREPPAVVAWVPRAAGGPLAVAGTAWGAAWLGAGWLGDHGAALVSGSAWTSWLEGVLAERRLGQLQRSPSNLDPVAVAALLAPRPPPSAERDVAAILAGRDLCLRERGLVGVLAEAGAGRSWLLDEASRRAGGRVVRASVPSRDVAGRPLSWLASTAGLPDTDDAAALVSALRSLPPTTFVVDDLHRLLTRAIGGSAPFRAVVAAMHATSDVHAWICGVHAPAWAYLAAVPQLVPLAAFRVVVRVPACDERELRAHVLGALAGAGLAPSFAHVVPVAASPRQAERALRSGESAYWRLLKQVSAGNPTTATRLVASGACRTAEPGTVALAPFDVPKAHGLGDLQDDGWFALASLLLHDGLSLADLARVLDLAEDALGVVVRGLVGRGVLTAGDVVTVSPDWVPLVRQRLHHKHFLRA